MVRDAKQKAELIASATHRQECSERNACDVELLSVGGFSPLTGFMNKDVYDHVVDNMRCARTNMHAAYAAVFRVSTSSQPLLCLGLGA